MNIFSIEDLRNMLPISYKYDPSVGTENIKMLSNFIKSFVIRNDIRSTEETQRSVEEEVQKRIHAEIYQNDILLFENNESSRKIKAIENMNNYTTGMNYTTGEKISARDLLFRSESSCDNIQKDINLPSSKDFDQSCEKSSCIKSNTEKEHLNSSENVLLADLVDAMPSAKTNTVTKLGDKSFQLLTDTFQCLTPSYKNPRDNTSKNTEDMFESKEKNENTDLRPVRIEVVERYVENIIEIPVEKIIENRVENIIEKLIEKENIIYKEIEEIKTIEVPIVNIIEVPQYCERIIEKEKIITVTINKPVEKIVDKIIEIPVEIIIEVPIETIIERPIEIETIIEKKIKITRETEIQKPVELKYVENEIDTELYTK